MASTNQDTEPVSSAANGESHGAQTESSASGAEDQSLLPGLNPAPLDQSTCPDGNPSQGGQCTVTIEEGESTCPEGASAEECPALHEQQALVPGTCPEGASAEECTLLQQESLVLDPDGCPEGTFTD